MPSGSPAILPEGKEADKRGGLRANGAETPPRPGGQRRPLSRTGGQPLVGVLVAARLGCRACGAGECGTGMPRLPLMRIGWPRRPSSGSGWSCWVLTSKRGVLSRSTAHRCYRPIAVLRNRTTPIDATTNYSILSLTKDARGTSNIACRRPDSAVPDACRPSKPSAARAAPRTGTSRRFPARCWSSDSKAGGTRSSPRPATLIAALLCSYGINGVGGHGIHGCPHSRLLCSYGRIQEPEPRTQTSKPNPHRPALRTPRTQNLEPRT